MSENTLFNIAVAIILILYILAGYLTITVAPKVTRTYNPFLRMLLLSFLLAMVFGIGVAATGGDPGFAFPVPVIVAVFTTNPDLIVNSAIIPFGFWWTLFFLVLLIRHFIRMYKNRRHQNIS